MSYLSRFAECPCCGERVLRDHLETDSGDCPMCEERRLWKKAAETARPAEQADAPTPSSEAR